MDVEAAVRDGCLDIGVFGAETVVSGVRAREIVEGVGTNIYSKEPN